MNLYLGISLLCASQAAATLLRGAPEGVHVISQSDRHLVNQDWTQMIEDFKPMVVNAEATSEVALEIESTGRWYATGFVVDAQRGIVATNAHVTGHSPSRVKINFFDGSFTEAKTLYYDPTHDFAFYKIDPQYVLFELQAVEIGKWRDLSLGDEVLLIGNNEREEYSIKYGHVSALNVNKGDRHSSYIHTTIDSAGGSSGSPVWNTAGQVIGIHSRGKATSSFELPAEYFADALGKLQRNDTIHRGEIGVDLELVSIGESIKHFNLPEFSRGEIGPSESGKPKVVMVEAMLPKSPGVDMLRSSDIIYRINGTLIRDDLYLFDKILDDLVPKGEVELDIYRNGKQHLLNVSISDLEVQKVRRFLLFAGAVFHDITPFLRRTLALSADGGWMSSASPGSSFSLWRMSSSGGARVVIQEINGAKIKKLDDFIEACRNIEDGQHTYVVARDMKLYQNAPKPEALTVNVQFDGLQLFDWNATSLEWDETSLEVGE